MPYASRIEGNVAFAGDVAFAGSVTLPSSAVLDANVYETRHREVYSQASGSSASDESRVIHVVHGTAGTLKSVMVGSVDKAVGDSTVDVDILKNGVSVLTAAVTLNSSNTDYVAVAGSINTAATTVGDVFEVEIDATAGTGTLPKGVFVSLEFLERIA